LFQLRTSSDRARKGRDLKGHRETGEGFWSLNPLLREEESKPRKKKKRPISNQNFSSFLSKPTRSDKFINILPVAGNGNGGGVTASELYVHWRPLCYTVRWKITYSSGSVYCRERWGWVGESATNLNSYLCLLLGAR